MGSSCHPGRPCCQRSDACDRRRSQPWQSHCISATYGIDTSTCFQWCELCIRHSIHKRRGFCHDFGEHRRTYRCRFRRCNWWLLWWLKFQLRRCYAIEDRCCGSRGIVWWCCCDHEPVRTVSGIAPPELELELPEEPPVAAAEAALVGPSVFTEVVAEATPLVNGVSDAELAPLKAGACVDAVGCADAVRLPGLRTPSITCITPLATRTSWVTTRALLTKISLSWIVIVTGIPSIVVSVLPLVNMLLYPTVPFTT